MNKTFLLALFCFFGLSTFAQLDLYPSGTSFSEEELSISLELEDGASVQLGDLNSSEKGLLMLFIRPECALFSKEPMASGYQRILLELLESARSEGHRILIVDAGAQANKNMRNSSYFSGVLNNYPISSSEYCLDSKGVLYQFFKVPILPFCLYFDEAMILKGSAGLINDELGLTGMDEMISLLKGRIATTDANKAEGCPAHD